MTSRLQLHRADFFPDLFANESLTLSRLGATSFRFARFLWETTPTGTAEDRSNWDGKQWQHYLTDPRCAFFVIYCDGEPAGCAELIVEPRLMLTKGGNVRLKAFGLIPEFSGEGLGSSVLTRVIEKAFATGATTVTMRAGDEVTEAALEIFLRQGFQTIATA